MGIKIDKEFRNIGLDYEDLINEGNIGLTQAVDKFDLEQFVKKVYETKEFEKGVNVEIFNLFYKKIINARVY